MTVFYWIALVLLLGNAVPCALYFAAYLSTGEERPREIAAKFFRWSSLVVLVTFNITIFKHIILIIIHW